MSTRDNVNTEPTGAGEQGMLEDMGARVVPPEPIRKPELCPEGQLLQADGTLQERQEPKPELFDTNGEEQDR